MHMPIVIVYRADRQVEVDCLLVEDLLMAAAQALSAVFGGHGEAGETGVEEPALKRHRRGAIVEHGCVAALDAAHAVLGEEGTHALAELGLGRAIHDVASPLEGP